MDDSLVICLLGEVTLRWSGTAPLDSLGNKELALLIYLAGTKRPQPREMLADLFWGTRPKGQGQANLRTLLARLRHRFPAHVVADRDTIIFDVDQAHWLDAAEFQVQASAADAPPLLPNGHLTRRAADKLTRALRLYQGDFLAGFHVHDANGFEDWAASERERLRRIALTGLARLSDFCLERSQYAAGIEYTTRLLALDPLDEAAHRQLMQLLALNDQRHIALIQYEICRQALADELDAEPDSETTALYQCIRDGEYYRSASNVDPVAPQQPAATQQEALKTRNTVNLPAPLTPLIGREAELARLHGRLLNPDCRLITVAGGGGVGKTHLALFAAAQVWLEFADDIHYVALADLASSERLEPQQARAALAAAIAEALGVAERGADQAAQLGESLRDAELLMLLDGMERLIGGADLLVELLRSAPNITILATSRQPLHLRSEHIVWLRGLPVPPSEQDPNASAFSSIRLFLERVERLGVEASIATHVSEMVQICRLAAGLPLAIELAAVLAGHLPLAEIAGTIEHNPNALTTTASDLPERHRSMRALFESSWQLLSQAERHILAQCSTFHSSFSFEAALAILRMEPTELRSALTALANQSLLHRSTNGHYELDHLARPFAAEKLAVLSSAA